jgi:hypothetical protein
VALGEKAGAPHLCAARARLARALLIAAANACYPQGGTMLKRSVTISACALAACTAALLMSPKPAHACGGLFCTIDPVDQNAERILFEVHPDGPVTATVEISYTGDPAAFSWIVPVPETPSHMGVAPVSALRLLDQATGPRIIAPPTTCTEPFGFRGAGVPSPSSEAAADAGTGVTVEDLPIVGPYNPQVISADDPALLVAWLEENNYTITDEMKPLIAEYVGSGYKFLGVKLIPDAGVADIAPLSFTCPNPEGPFIPLKLTAVASEPEMGVMVFVAASQRYASQNFRMLTVNTDQVQMDPRTGVSNYYPLVSWLVDQEGSTAFVTEFAAPSSEALNAAQNVFLPVADSEESMQWVSEVLGTHPYLTRMYTRISGWEMTDDPVFVASSGADVSNVHDLSGRPAVEVCGGGNGGGGSVPCGQTYCGLNQRCATTESGADACLCDAGFVARAITAPRGQGVSLGTTVTCQDASLDMLQSLEGTLDACAGNSCGEGGRCMPVNGFATCECDAGFAARLDFSGPNGRGLRCESVRQIYAPEQLLWPLGMNERAPDCACAGVPASGSLAGLAGVLLGLGLAFRRRRR